MSGVEDRRTPGIYLEMTSMGESDYAASRMPDVLRLPGVHRATWWQNAQPNRTDLPRTLPEFSLLGVYEIGDVFRTPAPAEGVTGIKYFRTARQGQGSLTGQVTNGLLLVLVSPKDPAQAKALRDWADFVHIRHIVESGVPGFTMITPYEHAERGNPRFLHLYEMNTDDPEGAFRQMVPRVQQRLGGGLGHPTFEDWAGHPQLVIDYVNTFALRGERVP